MRTVYLQPGYTESDFYDLLGSRLFVYADCYTITLQTGEVIRTTSAQQDVNINPVGDPLIRRFVAGDILVEGLKFKVGVGVEVDEQSVRIVYRDDSVVPDRLTPMLVALRRGDFDGSRITKDRYYAASWGEPWVGGYRLFSGRVASINGIGRTEADVNVRSDLALLNINMPHNIFQPSCLHVVYDSGCKLVKETFAVTGTIEAGSNNRLIVWPGASSTSLPLDQGVIYIENQDNVTFSRTIRRVVGSNIYLSFPLDFVPQVGMEFTAYPGCPRTYASCGAFGNTANFKGFPFVPKAETAY